jgi:outer membrane lipoprotein SlyB
MTRKLMACGLALAVLAGCASVDESDVYTPEELSRLEDYKLVTIVHAEEVMVDPESPGIIGAGAGAVSGGLIGSRVGGDGAIAALAVIGGLIGYAIEQQATDTTATRYVVDVDGRQQVVVQKDSDEPLAPGDTAMMIGDYEPRLVKAPQEPPAAPASARRPERSCSTTICSLSSPLPKANRRPRPGMAIRADPG